MRKLILFFIVIFSSPSFSQPFGNEWINYNQSYFKIKIVENGVYRISFQTLNNNGVPVSTINPKNFQLFARGKEVAIYIKGEADNDFGLTDYIEFYGEGNNGWLDTALYKGRDNQPNPYYSLINDTISYFLTWNNSTNNLRYQEENAIDFGNYFAAPYILKENIQVYNSNYYDGKILPSRATSPEYTQSEGWMDSPITLGQSKTKSISTPNRYTGGPFVDFEIQVVGASDWQSINNGDHHLRITFGSQLVDEIFEGYELKKINRSFSPTEIVRGNNLIVFESVNDLGVGVDRTALAYMKITYPHTLNLNNESYYEFLLENGTLQNAQYLEMLLFNGGTSPILYDLTNRKKIRVVETLSNYKMIVPNGNGIKKCVILNENQVKNVTQIFPVEETGTFTNHSSNITDTAFLIITHTSLFSQASTYATYRQSKGMYSAVVDVESLYDQYAYGIDKHPMAIRNFINQALTSWTHSPSHLFLLGKSVNSKDHRRGDLNTSAGLAARVAYSRNLVPSYGNPSADNLLISGLKNTNLEVPIPLGRLSAKNLTDVDIYLDKVIEYEAVQPAKWMKRALHFAGGKTVLETNIHEGYLNGFASDFQTGMIGGKVLLFQKNSSAPYQTTLADSVRNLINEGVSLMTFFGHSSATGGFDISIDSPDDLKNKGRYPVLLGNSCFAGNYHQSGITSTSEEYVIQRDAGVIAFIANGNLGIGSYLNDYSSAFYQNISKDNYGESIAESMRQAVKDVQSANTNELLKNVCIEMSMQGDPSLKLNPTFLPDYLVQTDHVSILPSEVTTDLSSFKIQIRVDNIGLSVSDSVLVQLNRKFPNSATNDSLITKVVAPISYERFVEFELPINSLTDVGQNEFTFLIDPLSQIQELNETNNRVDFQVLIRSGEIIPIYPYNYSIVGSQSPSLNASTAFAFESEKSYVFEVDTTSFFNSISKESATITSVGGMLSWNPTLLQNMPDSTVYYWRVSKVPAFGEPFNWRTASFQYIAGESGFSQDHFEQFNQNDYLFLQQNQSNRRFDFTTKASELAVTAIGNASSSEYNDVRYALDNDIREKGSCFPSPAFLIAILDSVTLDSWETPYYGRNLQNNFQQANSVNDWCAPNRYRAEKVFNFQARDTIQLRAMRDMLNNSIPKGNYVVIYNWFDIDYDAINAFDTTILQSFKNLGATVMNGIQNEYPFIITAKKGYPNSVVEAVGSSINDRISIKRILTTSADFGRMTSVELGPSQDFNRLSYRFSSLESNSYDRVLVELIGIDQSNNEQILFTSKELSLDTISSTLVDESIYKRLKLNFSGEDSANQTPPQLNRWQVNFTELPDAVLNPAGFLSVSKDSLEQGEELTFEVEIDNPTAVKLAQFKVNFSVIDGRREFHPITTLTIDSISSKSSATAQVTFSTGSLIGNNTLVIEVNPTAEALESNYFNNVGQYNFYVFEDRINPLLDVTFDGRHILNREIVSSKPTISINLKDNSSFLAIDDTSSFELYLRQPNGVEELINYGGNSDYQIVFTPATLPDNTAKVVFTPNLREDGIYQLRVRAKDKSGNESGNQDYRVEFEVVNKSTITHLLNYPNPFSTSTRFVFTLTGNEVPDQVLIQIMTVTGKVVREIDADELGPIHIGNNITEFAWDGKDEFGDQLANGVYLYRVKMKINGNNIERRNTSVDNAFVKDFGKMYLLR